MEADEMYRAPALPEELGDNNEPETGSDWYVWSPTIGPSNHLPAAPGSPSTIDPLSIATATSLASRLNWSESKPEG
jgi:hypothetical protein